MEKARDRRKRRGSGSSECFAVSIAVQEDAIVARASGDLDYQFAHLLHQQIKDTWQATPSAALVVDLSQVTFCDSMGVGVLVLLLNQSREQQAALALSGIPARLERILIITGLRTTFQVTPSVEEANQTVTPAPPAPAPPPVSAAVVQLVPPPVPASSE
ncbi:STAS domain-containing protein [Nonomuraea sp. MTCD27]|uniref:STAS domain-containing protein n=1 Tax=Nonomuraea sp. MTCD27 TaxID=1676747 RepID=UPI0035BF339E